MQTGPLRVSSIDWILLADHLAIVAWMGTRFARRQQPTVVYFIGSRKMPWWALVLSFFGTSISAGTFIAIPEQGFSGGLETDLLLKLVELQRENPVGPRIVVSCGD